MDRGAHCLAACCRCCSCAPSVWLSPPPWVHAHTRGCHRSWESIDMFMDTTWDLVVRSNGMFHANQNRMRLATVYSAKETLNPLKYSVGKY